MADLLKRNVALLLGLLAPQTASLWARVSSSELLRSASDMKLAALFLTVLTNSHWNNTTLMLTSPTEVLCNGDMFKVSWNTEKEEQATETFVIILYHTWVRL